VLSEDGRIEFIVLARGGFMGMGRDRVPVPWEAASLHRDQDNQLRAAITEQQLDGAPTLEEYAATGSPAYEQQVHSYYGTEPRTEEQQYRLPNGP